MLNISNDLKLPDNAVTQKLAQLGRTGSGKTYCAQKIAEEMLAIKAQVVALDPVGVWWALRLAANGKDAGFPIPVFGGLHGDVPLEPNGGALVANLIVDQNISAVIDVSQMISAEQTRFATEFATRLFERRKAKPSAMMLFLEECQEFIPQNPMKGEERMLHAFQRLVKIGRNFGIGASLISQRPQEVNKKVLNMTECLFAFQMTGPQERKAIRDWVADKDLALDVVDALPKLGVGEAHIWSPQWLKVSKQIKISQKRTYNGSSTPEVGKAAKTRDLAPIDLDRIRTEMAEAIERAKADDPKELRKQIAELKAQLARTASQGKEAKVDTEWIAERVKAAAASAELRAKAGMTAQLKAAVKAAEVLQGGALALRSALDKLLVEASEAGVTVVNISAMAAERVGELVPVIAKAVSASVNSGTNHGVAPAKARTPDTDALSKAERALLGVLAQFPCGRTRVQLSILSGYSSKSSSFANAIGALRSKGLASGSDPIVITSHGMSAVVGIEPVPTDAATLRRHWMASLGKAERTMLEVLCAHPELSRKELSERSGYSITSSSFANAIGRLKSLELVSGGPGGLIELAEELR